MTWSRTCDYCSATFCPGEAPTSCRHHESTGFGVANTEWFTLCSHECRARLRRELRSDDRPRTRATETELWEQAAEVSDPPLRDPEQSALTWERLRHNRPRTTIAHPPVGVKNTPNLSWFRASAIRRPAGDTPSDRSGEVLVACTASPTTSATTTRCGSRPPRPSSLSTLTTPRSVSPSASGSAAGSARPGYSASPPPTSTRDCRV